MLSNAEKFKQNAKIRLEKAIYAIKRIGYLSDGSNYSYTEGEIEILSRILKRELRNTLKLFKPKIRDRTILEGTFKLFKEKRDGSDELILEKTYPPVPSEGRSIEGFNAYEQLIDEAVKSGKVKDDQIEDLWGKWDQDVSDIQLLIKLDSERSKYWNRK